MEKLKNLFMKNEQGQVGIGTLIIFIAMVLVAAVAAAVLIQTSGDLQQKAQTTGEEATAEVSSNMEIESIEGIRGNHSTEQNLSDTIDFLKIRLSPSAGASEMDLRQLVVTITDTNEKNTLIYKDGNGKDTVENSKKNFTLNYIRDEDDSFSKSNPVMNQGDLITLNVSTVNDTNLITNINGIDANSATKSGLTLDPRTSVGITLTPESGTSKQLDIITPPSYGVDKRISLYP